jgi:hypothetical protein
MSQTKLKGSQRMDKPVIIKEDTTIKGATYGYGNHPLKVILEGWGLDPVWIIYNEHGACAVVHASDLHDAWDAWIDNAPTIDPSEVCEAYGLTQKDFDAIDCWDNGPNLCEGYTYQSNASGTGIVDTGHNTWLQVATVESLRGFGITLKIGRDD